MKIMCQEHYDKVVQYAESIGDSTLRECLERLERREQNPHHPCQIELYRDFAPYSFLFKERYPDKSGRCRRIGLSWMSGSVVLFYRPSLSRLGDPHLKNRLFMRMKILRYAADRDNRFRRCPYHRIRPSSGSVYPICPVSAATNDERQDTTLEGVCRTKHGNCISSG